MQGLGGRVRPLTFSRSWGIVCAWRFSVPRSACLGREGTSGLENGLWGAKVAYGGTSRGGALPAPALANIHRSLSGVWPRATTEHFDRGGFSMTAEGGAVRVFLDEAEALLFVKPAMWRAGAQGLLAVLQGCGFRAYFEWNVAMVLAGSEFDCVAALGEALLRHTGDRLGRFKELSGWFRCAPDGEKRSVYLSFKSLPSSEGCILFALERPGSPEGYPGGLEDFTMLAQQEWDALDGLLKQPPEKQQPEPAPV